MRSAPSILRVALHAAWVAVAMVFAFAGCGGPEYPNCRGDEQCASHQGVCVAGRCQQCRAPSDCPAEGGPTCLRNRCFAGPDGCENDGDCPTDRRCADNHCVTRAECDATRACPTGRSCVSGRCEVASTEDPEDNRGRMCSFQPVFFRDDNAILDGEARQTLQTAASCLGRERNSRYVLIGRSDPRGTTEWNLAIGEKRAREAQYYLVSLGVSEERIGVSSEGSEGAQGTDEAGWARDRRVDFRPRD